MKFTRIASAFALLALLGAQLHAQSEKTREQVRNELAEAIRNGDVLAPGESGLTLRELHPERFPAAPATVGKTRDQVRNELAEAMRTGDILANGDSGLTLREQNPQRYPAQVQVAGKTREHVKAELAEAIRTGDILANGDSGLRLNEVNPQLYAKVLRQRSDAVRQAVSAGANSTH